MTSPSCGRRSTNWIAPRCCARRGWSPRPNAASRACRTAFGRHHAPRDRADGRVSPRAFAAQPRPGTRRARSILSRAALHERRQPRLGGAGRGDPAAGTARRRARRSGGRSRQRSGASALRCGRRQGGGRAARSRVRARGRGAAPHGRARAHPAESRDRDASDAHRQQDAPGSGAARRTRCAQRMRPRGGARRSRVATRRAGSTSWKAPVRRVGSLDLQVSASDARVGAHPDGTLLGGAVGPPRRHLRLVGARAAAEPADPPRAAAARPRRWPPISRSFACCARPSRTGTGSSEPARRGAARSRRERQWSRTGAGEAHARASLGEALDSLGADDALLSYRLRRDASHAFSWSRTARVELVAPELDGRAIGPQRPAGRPRRVGDGHARDRWRPSCARASRTGSRRCRRLLVDPIAQLLSGASRIVLTVPGVLAGVPWMMLPALRGRVLTRRALGVRLGARAHAHVARAGVGGLRRGPARRARRGGGAARRQPRGATRRS